MRNRAKCKLCKDVIESKNEYDHVTCKCGEIELDGGIIGMWCSASDWNNFVRVDDENNEIVISVVEKEHVKQLDMQTKTKPSKKELVEILDRMIENIEELPKQAMQTYINHYDFCSALILIASILKEEKKDT